MDFNIIEIIATLISVLAAIIAKYIITLIRTQIKEKCRQHLKFTSMMAVEAAEQLGCTYMIKNKYEYAFNRTKSDLDACGIVFEDETIKSAIESAVLSLQDNKSKGINNDC